MAKRPGIDVKRDYGPVYKWFQGYVVTQGELPSYARLREEMARLGMRPKGGLKKLRSAMARQMVLDTQEIARDMLGMELSERRAQAILGFNLD